MIEPQYTEDIFIFNNDLTFLKLKDYHFNIIVHNFADQLRVRLNTQTFYKLYEFKTKTTIYMPT